MLDHAFVLNMPNSVERYQSFTRDWTGTGLDIERIDGVDGRMYFPEKTRPLNPGIVGCIFANRRLLEIAKLRGYDTCLILEDDAEPCDSFNAKLKTAIAELPQDWAVLRLHPTTTGTPGKQGHSENLWKVNGSNGTYGWVVSSKYYTRIIEVLNRELGVMHTDGYIKTFDVILAQYMNEMPFYETKERLVYHKDGFSDRMGMNMKFGLGKPHQKAAPAKQNRIKIVATPHVMNHAQELAATLYYNHQITVEVGTKIISGDDRLHILYQAYNGQLPKNYIVYQCEQLNSKWFTRQYWNAMRGAVAVWEWSEFNMSMYPDDIRHKVSYVPPGQVKAPCAPSAGIKYDVLFYGAINDHRANVLRRLKSSFKVKEVTNIYGPELLHLLKETKVVLNLHYYEKASLETFRVNEALCCGCEVVTEWRPDCNYPEIYHDKLYFATVIDEMKLLIAAALKATTPATIDDISNEQYVAAALQDLTSSVT